jgi:hypothetical protein
MKQIIDFVRLGIVKSAFCRKTGMRRYRTLARLNRQNSAARLFETKRPS